MSGKRERRVLPLKRSLYGLKDLAKIWYETIAKKLESCGLTKMKSDPCVFRKEGVIIICYVDGLLVFTENEKAIEDMKRELGASFIFKDLGTLKPFLGIDIDWTNAKEIRHTETRLIKKLLMTHGMSAAKPKESPIDVTSDPETQREDFSPDS